MKIKWVNILLLILIIAAVYTLVKVWPAIRDARDRIEAIHDQVNPTFTFIVIIGMVLLTVITIVHIICNKR